MPKFKIEVHAKILNYELYLEVSSSFEKSSSLGLMVKVSVSLTVSTVVPVENWVYDIDSPGFSTLPGFIAL